MSVTLNVELMMAWRSSKGFDVRSLLDDLEELSRGFDVRSLLDDLEELWRGFDVRSLIGGALERCW